MKHTEGETLIPVSKTDLEKLKDIYEGYFHDWPHLLEDEDYEWFSNFMEEVINSLEHSK